MESKTGLTGEQRRAVDDFRNRYQTGVLTLLFTDTVGSTQLKQRLGDAAGTERLRRQQALVREILGTFDHAEEISTAGDSFFIVFRKPSDAVRFSLRLQNALRSADEAHEESAPIRIGIHMGEVFIEEKGEGALTRDVLGVHVDTAARVMSLADGGQILLTRPVFDNARTILTGEALPGIAGLSWANHGPYLLKGIDEAVDVCEVGERDKASMKPPTDTDTGKRATVAGAEPVLGWRPAVEQVVPGTEWQLERQLGEGGFGEVWLAQHRRTGDQRVFKFCFRADQLRNLKREMTLFRLLKEVLGERPDIARLYNVQFEQAPYYLELEYTPGGDLADWIESRGGFERVPMEQRVEIVAQVATALAAAHSVGVIHEDVKPSNVLVEEQKDGSIQVRLTDFGIGQITDRSIIQQAGLTATGLTEMISPSGELSTRTGTRLYMAPELVAGRPPSTRSDIYSLGVLFYQMIVGDLAKPVAIDWDRHIDDPLIHHDLHHCLAGDPNDRFASADELAESLRSLEARRAEFVSREEAERALARRRRAAVVFGFAAGLSLLVAALLGYGFHLQNVAYHKMEREYYYGMIALINQTIENSDFARARELLLKCPKQHRNWEWGWMLARCNRDMMTLEGHTGAVAAIAYSPDGKRLASAARFAISREKDCVGRIWDTQSGRLLHELKGHTGWLRSISFSPDGKLVATGSEDRTAKIWEAETGRELHTLSGHMAAVIGSVFLPDGKRLVTGSEDRKLRVWDVESGDLITSRVIETNAISAAPSPDGRLVAVGLPNGSLVLIELLTGNRLRTYEGLKSGVVSVAFSRDGKRIAAGDAQGTAMVWNAETGEAQLTLEGHRLEVYGIDFSPDGKRLATGSNERTIKVWDANTGKLLQTLRGHSKGIYSLKYSPDGRTLATGSYDGSVKIWNPDLAEEPFRLTGLGTGNSDAKRVAFSPGGRLAGISGGAINHEAKVYAAQTGRELLALGANVYTIAFSPDGRFLAAPEGAVTMWGGANGSVGVWDLETARKLREIGGGLQPITAIAISPDSLTIAVGGYDRAVILYNAETGEEKKRFEGHTDPIRAVAFGREGRFAASGGDDGTARVWEAETGRQVYEFPHERPVLSVAFGPNGKYLAAATYQTITIWDLHNGRVAYTLKGHIGAIHSVDFSPDGTRIVTGGRPGGEVNIWDPETEREILSFRIHPRNAAAVFDPTGLRIASASEAPEGAIWTAFPWNENQYQGGPDEPFFERVERYKRDYWRRRTAAAMTTAPVSLAHRIVDASAFSPGNPYDVQLDLKWNADAPWIRVHEYLPEGWKVDKAAEREGQKVEVDGRSIYWELENWTSPGVTLEYSAIPPAHADRLPTYFREAIIRSDYGWQRLPDTTIAPLGVTLFQEEAFPNSDVDVCRDAHILIYQPNLNTGGCAFIEEGDWYGSDHDHKKILIRFDLSSVPSAFPLGRAEIALYCFGERRFGRRIPHTVNIARLLRDWGEGVGDFHDGRAPGEGDVTFQSARHEQGPWEKPGAMGLTDATDPESSATLGENWPEWITFDVTDSVRYFLDHPEENFGWKISQDPRQGLDDDATTYAAGAYMFHSSEAPEVHLRPTLVLIPAEDDS